MSMTDITSKLLQSYRAKRTTMPDTTDESTDVRWSYLQAAAVLYCFYPEKLNPLTDVSITVSPRTILYNDITYSPGRSSEGIFTLNINKRKEALKKFSSREQMLWAVLKNPDQPVTTLQIMWVNYLQTGLLPDPQTLSYNSLTELVQIINWLEGIDTTIPDKELVENLIRQRSVLSNFEHLVINNFTGRETELAVLRRHINPSAGNNKKGFFDVISDWLSTTDPRPILSIYGPGGIGKSALSGRLLWENVQSSVDNRIPFAYMAFDQGILRIESPFTVLVEAASQFAQQFPEYEGHIETFKTVVRNYREGRDSLINREDISNSRNEKLVKALESDNALYESFVMLLESLSQFKEHDTVQTRKVLLVFDTFEEVEYRDFESLSRFWNMLSRLIELSPALRIIISGRTSVAKLGVHPELLTELALQELKQPDGSLLLQRLGVDKEIADAVSKQVGGNPLSLRLAANLVLSDKAAANAKGIKDLDTRKWLFFQVNEQVIQGQLYKRILDHIHDENVRKLAHPGMVLRSVTPDIILYVLAPQCNIQVNDIEEAKNLFLELKKEQALVENGYHGDLVYRPELRQTMVRLLQQDKFNEVRELRRAAISYYEQKEDLLSRAEEMYHRLALDEDDFYTLDSRWMQGIETAVASNLEEYSDRIKVWLGSRLNLELPREVFEKADIADWERNTARKVIKAMAYNDQMRALELLGERDARTDSSPLYALEAKCYILITSLDEATKILDTGIEKLSGSGNRGRLAELFWLRSQVELMQNKEVPADESLKLAGKAIENAHNPLPYMHTLCHRLIMRQKPGFTFTDTAAALRMELNKACERVNETNGYDMKFVLPMALSLLENEFPKTAERLSPYVSYTYQYSPDILTSENLQGLEEFKEHWENDDENYSEQEALV